MRVWRVARGGYASGGEWRVASFELSQLPICLRLFLVALALLLNLNRVSMALGDQRGQRATGHSQADCSCSGRICACACALSDGTVARTRLCSSLLFPCRWRLVPPIAHNGNVNCTQCTMHNAPCSAINNHTIPVLVVRRLGLCFSVHNKKLATKGAT
jgi:hypothetical protein